MKQILKYVISIISIFLWTIMMFFFYIIDDIYDFNIHIIFLLITIISLVIWLLRDKKIKQLEAEIKRLKEAQETTNPDPCEEPYRPRRSS